MSVKVFSAYFSKIRLRDTFLSIEFDAK